MTFLAFSNSSMGGPADPGSFAVPGRSPSAGGAAKPTTVSTAAACLAEIANQCLIDFGIAQVPFGGDNVPQLGEDVERTFDLLVGAEKTDFIVADDDIDADRFADAAQMLIARAKECANLVLIRK